MHIFLIVLLVVFGLLILATSLMALRNMARLNAQYDAGAAAAVKAVRTGAAKTARHRLFPSWRGHYTYVWQGQTREMDSANLYGSEKKVPAEISVYELESGYRMERIDLENYFVHSTLPVWVAVIVLIVYFILVLLGY